MKKLISIILPIFNEEENIRPIYNALKSLLEPLEHRYDFELIFVNDGSVDQSWPILRELAHRDKTVRVVSFSRNFGHQMALTAGYDLAKGDALITMDADGQDPPKLILDMLSKWEEGVQIVYARRIDRKDSFLKQVTAKVYYRFLDVVSDVKIPRNVGDFRLIDRKVLNTLNQCREKARYIRGMVAWTGFSHAMIDFSRTNRTAGSTGYTWKKMFRLAFDGMTSFSMFPLKLAAYVGVFVIVTGLLMFAYICWDTLLYQVNYPLFKWLVTVVYIFMGVQFILLWFLGEYIGRIHDQQKGRPLYVIADEINTAKECDEARV
ncbi:MAG: glycosyltransferase family 2 protein [Verrucomicrobia bacterium]|nr:glycosyltransferase family 2 protein [Verrucomicrobiota bacterium]MBU6445925.1 glycosyltransferase family 2 protein [Verrucomicrobiota bacterium]MDE3047521.1 glycosyltransferase family 2 protein [Verrucomicrobiota bacterium]